MEKEFCWDGENEERSPLLPNVSEGFSLHPSAGRVQAQVWAAPYL